MKHANLELSIEQLLLPEMPYQQRLEVSAALEAELTRLWNEAGIPASWVGESLALSNTTVEVAAGTSAANMGIHLAQSIYNQIGGANQPSSATRRSA